MTICFYSPYLPHHYGGGEKHLFDVALAAAQYHTVSVAITQSRITPAHGLLQIQKKYEKFLDTSLDALTFISTPLGSEDSFFSKLKWTDQFDALYYVTDGSLFFSLADTNYLHIQVPFTSSKYALIERVKLLNWKHKNTNSEFTKKVIEKKWRTRIDQVINPMVDTSLFKPKTAKKKTILSVGRFFKNLHSKRQDVLIDIFAQLCQLHPDAIKGWELILAGSVEDEQYVKQLQKQARDLPVKFKLHISRTELLELYQTSALYWHAAGFGIDEHVEPEKAEHFGISTIEAMAGGAVPIVHYKGGPKEILGDNLKQLGWLTIDECISKTVRLITDTKAQDIIRRQVIARAADFSRRVFEKKVEHLFAYEK